MRVPLPSEGMGTDADGTDALGPLLDHWSAPKDAPHLIFADHRDWREDFRCVGELIERTQDHGILFVVTCMCDRTTKSRAFNDVFPKPPLRGTMFTPECEGVETLEALLRTIFSLRCAAD